MTHQARYSNALIGLHEHFTRHQLAAMADAEGGLSGDDRLLRRFRLRQRRLVEADLMVVAYDHWNFNVRDFNPGGNHGSFLRASTHSTLMLTGGERTQIPVGLVIAEPYDSLSFAPTILALMGKSAERAKLPGKVIEGLLPPDR